MKFFKRQPDGDVLLTKIEPQEEIIEKLKELGQFLDSASFTGIGAVKSASIGYFDGKDYQRKTFDEPPGYEIVSLIGNISKFENETIVHCHVQLAGKDYKVFGGHLFEGIVSVTAEITVVPITPAIQREVDKKTGLKLWP